MRNPFGDKPGHGGFHREKTMPSGDFGANGQIEILAERVARPAAGRLYRGAAPDAASAVELKQPAGPKARRLLDHEMSVEHQTLRSGQPICPVVCEFASRLHEARAWDRRSRRARPPAANSRGGRKSASRMATKGASELSESRSQGACFVAAALGPVKVRNIVALRGADSQTTALAIAVVSSVLSSRS